MLLTEDIWCSMVDQKNAELLRRALAVEYSIYPIEIVMSGNSRYSLWGGNYPDGSDRILRKGGRILLFNRAEDIFSLGNSYADSTFEIRGLRVRLQEIARSLDVEGEFGLAPDEVVDVDGAENAIEGQSGHYGEVITAISLFRDCANEIGDRAAVEKFSGHDFQLLWKAAWDEGGHSMEPRFISVFRDACDWFKERAQIISG